MARGNGFDDLIEIEKQNKKILRALNKMKPIALRDQFASAALAGLASACNSDGEWTYGSPKNIAICSYELADAMLKARDDK